jgi:hypothetical protein
MFKNIIDQLNYQKCICVTGIDGWIKLIESQEKRRNEELLNEFSKELL